MIFADKTNTEIMGIIDQLKISARDKAILAERIFDGATYDSIIKKHYGYILPIRVYKEKVREIQELQKKVYKAMS